MLNAVYNLLLAQHERDTKKRTGEQVSIDLDTDIVYTLMLTAEAARISFNDYINQILKEYVDDVL
jgi:predicted HicB family RNase H-like nuclease